MESFSALNDVLVGLFRYILLSEENTIITEEYKDISCNDMHIIEAIGIGEPKNMSTVANALMITISTLTTGISALVKKGYVVKTKSDTDRRVVYLQLTERGVAAYKHHEEFHIAMTDEVTKELTDEEIEVLVKALKRISGYFQLRR